MSPERAARRDAKIARALIRLKHALRADDEIEDFLEAQRDALLNGRVLSLDVDLADLDS